MSAPPRLAYAAWIAVCVIWGTTYLGIRVAVETVPPALMGGFRWTVAGLVLAAVLRLRGEPLPPRSAWPGLLLVGVLMLGFGNGFVNWAEQYVPSGLAAVVIATAPFWMAGVEAALPGGERLNTWTLAGLLIGFGGILLLVWPDLNPGGAAGLRFAAGVAALQIACLGWALGSSYSKRRSQAGGSVLAATTVQMLCGGIVMLAAGTLLGEWEHLSFTPRTLGALVYLTLAGSIGGYVAYIYALKHLPVSTVSLYAYVNPLIAVVLGAVFLGEPFGARTLAAIAVVFAGVALVRSRRERRLPAAAARAGAPPVVERAGV